MAIFSLIVKCLPFLALLGMGLYVLFIALFPSWREKGWKHWRVFDGCDDTNDPNSWWVAVGLVKPRKPLKEGDWDEKTAIWFYSCLGAVLSLIAITGLVWVCRTHS